MNEDLHQFLQTEGVATRRTILRVVDHHVLERAVKSGVVTRLYPRSYALTGRADRETRLRAAILFVDGQGALSHSTALAVWGVSVPESESDEIHVTVPADSGHRSAQGIHVHRRGNFRVGPPLTVVRNQLAVVRLERAVVETWPLIADPYDRRQPAIAAVGQRLTTPQRLIEEVRSVPNLPGRAALLDLLGLLDAGCRSQLEIHGYLHVFIHPSLPRPRLQLPVKIGSKTIYLDLAYEEEKLNFEFDGPTYHPNPMLDHERDGLLARDGWQTIRWAPAKLRAPDAARAEARSIIATRRRQLGLPPLWLP